MASEADARAGRKKRQGRGARNGAARARNGRNLNAFVAGTTPRFEVDDAGPERATDLMADQPEARRTEGKAPEGGLQRPLSEVWEYYDQPYGHEVPLVLEDGVESYAFYVPHLSAVQVYGRARGEGADGAAPMIAALEERGDSSVKLLDFFETAKPNKRVPLLDRISELDEAHEGVLTGSAVDLDCSRSWYSISWFPILCDQYNSDAVRGCFLTYHRFRAGPCPFAIEDDIREMGGPPFMSAAKDGAGAQVQARTQAAAPVPPAAVPGPWQQRGEAAAAAQAAAAQAAQAPGVGQCNHEFCAHQNGAAGGGGTCRFLSVFGLVPYKVREPTWEGASPAPRGAADPAGIGMNTNCQRHEHPGLAELRDSADAMLSASKVSHPDYLHFSRR